MLRVAIWEMFKRFSISYKTTLGRIYEGKAGARAGMGLGTLGPFPLNKGGERGGEAGGEGGGWHICMYVYMYVCMYVYKYINKKYI